MAGSAIAMEKTIRITGKRQITIPQKFFEALGFGTEAECTLRNNELVIRPKRDSNGGEFAEQILAELIAQGVTGEELLCAFRRRQAEVRPAVQRMLEDAAQAARGRSEYVAYDDVFKE